jgi:RNA polymerase sigma-70 factor (ECF subfamily)
MNIKDVGDELVAAYAELRRFLARQLRNTDDAADVAQSSFERVYAHALAGPVSSPRALLFHTARNICIDHSRHHAVARAWLEEHMALNGEDTAPSVEHVVAQRQLVERVFVLLQQLPERRREVFLLFRAYGYSREEIAARLGITEAAVAKHVVRATLDCARVMNGLEAS